MSSLLLVVTSNHKSIAKAFLKAFRESGYDVSVFTEKSSPTTVTKSTNISACIWLISPETSKRLNFRHLHRALIQDNTPIVPVLVELGQGVNPPQNAIDARHNVTLAITKSLNYLDKLERANLTARQSSKSKFPIIGIGIVGLILLLGIGTIFAARSQSEEILPTLVAFESDLQAKITIEPSPTIATPTLMVMVTPIQAIQAISSSATEAILDVEATEEVSPEATEEIDFLPTDTSLITNLPLLADFLVDTPFGDAPLSIGIDNLSVGDIQDVQWDFNGDGVIDSVDYAPTEYIYYQPGIYTITLIVRDKSGHIAQSQSHIEVFNPNSQASVISGNFQAGFIVSPASGKAPLKVTFVNRSQGKNLSYQWDFNGDGQIDARTNSPQPYTYTKPGNYNASLTVINADGSQNKTQTLINVYSVDPNASVTQVYKEDSQAKFSVSKSSGSVPLLLEVTNSSTGINNLYEWDFNGDGRPDSASAQPSIYRYTSPGTYTLKLTVNGFDRYGVAKKTQSQLAIVVNGRTNTPTTGGNGNPINNEELELQADFLSYYTEGSAPLTVQFFNYSTGNNLSYQWDFDGNGSVDSTEIEPTYIYNSGGSFEAFLTVSDGVSSSSTSIIIDVPQAGGLPTSTATVTPKAKSSSTPAQIASATATAPANPTLTVVSPSTVTPITATKTASTPSTAQTATLNFTATWTLTPTATPSLTPTWTYTATVIPSLTPVPTLTFTAIPTSTPLPTSTFTSIPTLTPQPTSTFTPTATIETGS